MSKKKSQKMKICFTKNNLTKFVILKDEGWRRSQWVAGNHTVLIFLNMKEPQRETKGIWINSQKAL